jgi:hypothetical protein
MVSWVKTQFIFYFVMECKPTTNSLVFTNKEAWELHDEIRMNSWTTVQSEINLQKLRKKKLMQIETKMVRKWSTINPQDTLGPNLGNAHLLSSLIIYYVINNMGYIKVPKSLHSRIFLIPNFAKL